MSTFPIPSLSHRWLAPLALATVLAGCATPDIRGVSSFRVPPGNVPPVGQCAIWYPGLPASHQPPAMSCNKAHADAETWGGVVIWAESAAARRSGEVAYVRYGNHGLNGIPPGQLPPPGRCRLWQPQAAAARWAATAASRLPPHRGAAAHQRRAGALHAGQRPALSEHSHQVSLSCRCCTAGFPRLEPRAPCAEIAQVCSGKTGGAASCRPPPPTAFCGAGATTC
jgi:hypothetical protein